MVNQHVDIKSHFLNNFPLLSKKQQKVWSYLQKHAQTWIVSIINQEDIAKKINASRETVNRSIKKFESFEWVKQVKRPYNHSVYYLNEELININTKGLKP